MPVLDRAYWRAVDHAKRRLDRLNLSNPQAVVSGHRRAERHFQLGCRGNGAAQPPHPGHPDSVRQTGARPVRTSRAAASATVKCIVSRTLV